MPERADAACGASAPSAEAAWAESEIRNVRGARWSLASAQPVASRMARVFRLVVTDGTQRSGYYLKQFSAEGIDDLGLYLQRLKAVSTALQRVPGITPYIVIGYDLERRLLLTQEMSGESILNIHHRVNRRLGVGAAELIDAWRGVGLLLRSLHRALPPQTSSLHAAQLGQYTSERFNAWTAVDRTYRTLGRQALETIETVIRLVGHEPVTLVPCHGDVSGYNILVDRTVGLVDFDDLRFDLPGLDISQSLLDIKHSSRIASLIPLPGIIRGSTDALLTGYDDHIIGGPRFWLPHLRNLSVFLLTLSRRRKGFGPSRLSDELHYRQTIRELENTLIAVAQA